ncbi:MAG: LytTR family DNA-binding domain-containing protein [Thermincola sp.]|jgi:DNA-binding LytR/AlgR family response regulator|nr:LytTR family DNA-binding domain-containing protein [Thermincola sp.]MDT3704323.1 LytTR family DNA-binding domain-containing protein [Thermincola sp.]
MTLRVLIAEDNRYTALFLKQVIEEIPNMKVINISNNGREAIKNTEILRPNVIFMDIDMPDVNGLLVAKEAIEIIPNVKLIFATGHTEYALEAFELYPFDYILKPFDEKRIHKTLRRIKDGMLRSKESNNSIVIPLEGRRVVIKAEEILFVEITGHKLKFKTERGEYTTRGDLSQVESQLDSRIFFRSHKGYLVNLKQVKEIVPANRTFEMILFSGDRVLLSREREKILRVLCLNN